MRGIDEEAAIEKYSKDYVKSKEDATKGISKDQSNVFQFIDIRDIIFKKMKRELMDALSF